MLRRVVVTGMGLVTPLGCGTVDDPVKPVWKRLIEGQSGAGPITRFDASNLPVRIAAEVPLRKDHPDDPLAFAAEEWVEPKLIRRNEDFILYALAAADMAIRNAGLPLESDAEKNATGVMIGSGIGGLGGIADTTRLLDAKGPGRVSPFFIPSALINLSAGQVSIKYGLRGPNSSIVTACATGVHAIGDAARLVALGDADAMVAGGTEASICDIGVAGFVACKALSTGFNDRPTAASRPYDKDRDGFLMGEGAGIVVLEEYERAKARGATIYGEIAGYGLSGDAYHVTAPDPEGDGGYRAMKAALARAGLAPADIDYINAHGTSTPLGDEIELKAVERLWGDDARGLVMSSTKSATGHLLGAAGAVEAVFSLMALQEGICPPTINLDAPSVETKINLAANSAVEKPINAVLSNSFGFGGTNASLVITRV
ncbi:3-oxoacyl-(acyl carrier protein) synthase [Parvularcula bermudensis HTCC2503]|uniref:3-oxoacyl-[acyl-carrier-protein] synthase 2 n=1 Tax=Parvularcula bermudensis (strain ATCC BAA-594 / HTCC2503 / KCTC 12087) TaxID=314260 RepID=E0TC37_PARBH|nr:beta-ketoacyl-ACP synthase II [Parvularcula bermudensis]ADM10295.1 3-oxoacyl-(acyl carrier protein) synthase [Parvularcula bermudensis HTCC2503]